MTLSFGQPAYGLTRRLPDLSLDAAIPRVVEALAGQGFGVLTEIDVEATLKKKLDVDFAPYTILGACNPPIAHQALSEEPGIGLLLPCNVVVVQDDDGVVVSAIDPLRMFTVLDRPDIEPLAQQVRELLLAALGSLEG